MDGSASKPGHTTRGIGLVKAGVNLCGNRNIADVNSPSLKKDFSTVCMFLINLQLAAVDTIFSTKLVCAIFLNKNFYKFVTIK